MHAFVLGNESADLDSAVSAIVLVRLFQIFANALPVLSERFEKLITQLDSEDSAACLTFLAILKLLNDVNGIEIAAALPISHTLFRKTLAHQVLEGLGFEQEILGVRFLDRSLQVGAKYVLVDHNHAADVEMIGCFDHHVMAYGAVPPQNSYIRVPRASTCALIGQICEQVKILETEPAQLTRLSALLAMVIRIDSFDFKESCKNVRWVKKDREVYLALSTGQEDVIDSIYARSRELKRKYKEALGQGNLSLHEILLTDNKIFKYAEDRQLIYASSPVQLRSLIAELDQSKVDQEFNEFLRDSMQGSGRTDNCFVVTSKWANHRELSLAGLMSGDDSPCSKFDKLEEAIKSLFPSSKWYSKREIYGKWVYSCVKIDSTNTRKIVEPLLRTAWQ